MWPPGHPGHEDAKRHLQTTYNMPDDYDEKAKEFGRKVGLIESTDTEKKPKAPKPRPKPDQPTKKKKKKTLKDYFSFDEPAEFGKGTKESLSNIEGSIDSDFLRMGMPPQRSSGMSFTPSLPPPREDIFSGANSPFADPTYRAR
jgi:hypothetical protein